MTGAVAMAADGRAPGVPAGARVPAVDLRLAGGVGAGWLAVLAAVRSSSAAALTAAAIFLAFGAVALLTLRGRRAALGSTCAAAAFCIALLLGPLSARLAHARDSPLARLAHAGVEATLDLRVQSDPRPLRATAGSGAARVAVDAQVTAVRTAGVVRRWNGAVLVLGPAGLWQDMLPGQRVRLDGRLQSPLGHDLLTATVVARSPPTSIGDPPWWQRAAGVVRSALRRAAAPLPDGPRGLLPGLVDGDTGALDPVLAERFRIAGLTHLVAVSGTNCSIVVGAVLLVLRRMRCRPVVCAACGAVVLLAFVVVARPSPSVLRAAVMAGVALGALAAGRPRDGVPLLSASVLGLLLWQPSLASDVGFAMSVAATGALLVLAPGWAVALRARRVPPVLAESLAVAAAAHLVTVPLVAAISGRVSLVAIPANMLAEPVVALTTMLGFATALFAPVSLGVGTLLAQLAGWPCRWLVWVADYFGTLDGASVPWPSGVGGGLALAALIASLVWVASRSRHRRLLLVAGLVAVVVQIPIRHVVTSWPPPGWAFVACDIGQGDALVLPAAAHSAVVVDTGPDPVSVDRCLRDLGVTDVALLLISHDHLDHVGGISGVLRGRRVRGILTGPLAEPVSGERLVQASAVAHGLQTRVGTPGTHLVVGSVQLDVLGPAATFRGTRSDPNNSSLVVRATVSGIRLLLPGDAELDAQQALLDSGVDLKADVLKVPHHGSAYSLPAFLAAVHARVAVISVGLHNDYGHPSPLLLGRLAQLGVPVRRTDRDGDVAIVAGARLSTVVRPVTDRALAARDPFGLRGGPLAAVPSRGIRRRHVSSAGPATMATWRTWHPSIRPPTVLPRWSCWWVTRNCSSPVPSSRSPPPRGGSIPPQTSESGSAPTSIRRSCPNS